MSPTNDDRRLVEFDGTLITVTGDITDEEAIAYYKKAIEGEPDAEDDDEVEDDGDDIILGIATGEKVKEP